MNKKIFLLSSSILILLTGCQKTLGYGLLYWSENESPVTGSTLQVYSESSITNTFLVSSENSKDKTEVDKWRVGLFENETDFNSALKEFTPYIDSYAMCQRNLPLREKAMANAQNIYKLQEGQILKVLSRAEEKVQIGNLEGYWYKLLTEDGVIGYTFDYYLTVYNQSTNGERELLNERIEEDIHLDNIVDTLWRPDYYRTMLNRGMVDMNTFREEFRLFINSETKTIYLKTSEREIAVDYEKISNTAYKNYAFLGTTFRIEVYSDTLMSVQYNYEDREYKDAFVHLTTPVQDILVQAQETRDEQLFGLIDNGPVYSSQGYGDLEFQEGGRFSWVKKTTLISRKVVSSAAGNSGRISFNLFPDPDIKDKYTGGFILTFNNGEKLNFLFSIKENGIQLLYIPARYINNQAIVTTDNFYDPITMFFSAPPKAELPSVPVEPAF